MMMIFRGTDIEQDNNGSIFIPERIVVCFLVIPLELGV